MAMSVFDPGCVDVEDFLDVVEARNIEKATDEEFKFSCPLPSHVGTDESPSCYMNSRTTAFFCHGCHAKGNAIHFTQQLYEVTYLDAVRMLKERYSPAGLNPDARGMVAEVKKILERDEEVETQNYPLPEDVLDEFAVDWEAAYEAYTEGAGHPGTDYLFKRGFEPETLTYWNFGYDERSGRITFPICDSSGALVGVKARAIDDRRPKYLILGDQPGRPARYGFPCYQKSLVVFGLDEYIQYAEALEHGDPAEMIVVEGELNTVMLWQYGHRNSVAINGSYISAWQLANIKAWCDTAILFFDSLKRDDEGELVPDQAGQDATATVSDLLYRHVNVKIVPEHEGDPASMSPSEVDAMISGAYGFLAARLMS
jgi:DNA primase